MSENDFQVNKINKHILSSVRILSLLSERIEEFSETGTQESLDNLTFLLEQIDKQSALTKQYILNLIKTIAGAEDGEVHVTDTENGFEF